MNIKLRKNSVVKLVALLGLTICSAATINAGNLQDIQVNAIDANVIELRFKLDTPAPDPLSFTIESPARIALDLPGTAMALSERSKKVDLGILNSILTAESNGRTRVVLNLDNLVPYQTRLEGNDMVVTLGGASSSYNNTFVSETSSDYRGSQLPVSYTQSSYGTVGGIDFRRAKDGAGQVVVKLADPSTTVDISEEGGKIVATFKGVNAPAQLLKRMDVLDFATPITSIDTSQRGNDMRMVISAEGDYDQLAYQSEDIFTVEVREAVQVPTELLSLEERIYKGQPINLNFQSIDVRAVLQVLASTGDFNIVVSDTVTGQVTLRLQNVPWDQALDIVLQTKGLDKRTKDNVIIVAPTAELAAQERQQLEAIQDLEGLAPLRTDIIQINYAKAGDIKELLEEGRRGGSQSGEGSGNSNGQSFISARGSVTIDERTNTLLVHDTSEKLEDIRKLIRTLDVPVSQVLIESRVVIANTDFSRDIGVRAGFTGVKDNSSDGLISVTGSATGNDITISSALDNLSSNGSVGAVTAPSLADRLNVNLPVTSPAGRIGLAILDNDFLVDLELSALQAEGEGEVISSPRVTATNQQEASILQGVQIPFQESSGGASGATTTSFKDAVLSMTVTPLITPDNYIIMDLDISQDSIGSIVGSQPSINTRRINTQVRVPNGETAVLGGIYETTQTSSIRKVPVLGDIPVVGNMFKSRSRIDNKSEMLIFITPKVLNDNNLNGY